MLDQARCSTPGCIADHGPLWLKGVCHPRAAAELGRVDNVLTVRCKKCRRAIIDIRVPHEDTPGPTTPPCHPVAGVWVVYSLGVLVLTCHRCEEPFREIKVPEGS